MGASRLVICHWNEGGRWEAVEIDTNALNGHDNHRLDIWPEVPDVTPGMNWPQGENVYLNGCSIAAEAQPSPTAAPTPSLPTSGADAAILLLVAAVLIIVGLLLLVYQRLRSQS